MQFNYSEDNIILTKTNKDMFLPETLFQSSGWSIDWMADL